MTDIDRHELLTHIGYIRDDIKGVNDRLDSLNGRVRTNQTDIGVLKERSDASKADGRKWGAGAGAAAGGLWWVLSKMLGHG